MFKKVIFTLFIFCSFSLASNPICSINQELNKDTLSKLDKYRPQTLQTCMECNEGTCTMKAWPAEKKADAAICKLLFCTPAYVSKVFKKPEGAKSGKTKIKFTFIVNGEGKIKNIDITEAKGAMNSRESYKYLQSFTKKTQYKPLMVNGTMTSISLQGEHIAYTGKYEDPDKTMPARSDTWRN